MKRSFDNSGSKRGPKAPSFIFNVNGKKFLYTYIRKNACSSFKNFYRHLNLDGNKNYPNLPDIMIRNSAVNQNKIPSNCLYKCFVYRNPIDRVFSCFKNKLIEGKTSPEFRSGLLNACKQKIENITFKSFIFDYLTKLPKVDVHLTPQQWHLLPIVYNKPMEIKNLYNEMTDIIGEELSTKHFKKLRNASAGSRSEYSLTNEDTPLKVHMANLKNDNLMPSLESVMTSEIQNTIQKIYRCDFDMIKKIEKSS